MSDTFSADIGHAIKWLKCVSQATSVRLPRHARLMMLVVGILPISKQTKESARRYVIYCVRLGHMFVLVGCGRGARPYVSIMRSWDICLYWLAVGVGLGHIFQFIRVRCFRFGGSLAGSVPLGGEFHLGNLGKSFTRRK